MSGDIFAGTSHELSYSRPWLVFNGCQAAEIMAGTVRGSELQVFVALANHCRADWVCWPSRKRIAELTGITDRAVTTALGRLLKRRWIAKAGATPGGVVRYRLAGPTAEQLQAPTVPGGGGTGVPGGVEASFHQKGKGIEGRSSLGEGGDPPASLSVSDWEECEKSYGGRVTPEARGRFFQLGKKSGLTWEGEQQLKERLAFFEACYEKLNWAMPTLASVLDPAQGKLSDVFLEGLEGDAKRATEGRRK